MKNLLLERVTFSLNSIFTLFIFSDIIQKFYKNINNVMRLFYVIFKNNVYKISPVNINWIKILKNNDVEFFKNLQYIHFAKKLNYSITFWFINFHQNIDEFKYDYFALFVDTTKYYKSDFRLCINENNEYWILLTKSNFVFNDINTLKV